MMSFTTGCYDLSMPKSLAGIRSLAHLNFVAKTQREAIAQYVLIALERRHWAKTDSLLGYRGLSWKLAKKAIRRAKRIKAAGRWNWMDVYLGPDLQA